MVDRRTMMTGATLVTLLGGAVTAAPPAEPYGQIGRIKAAPGQREALAALILAGTAAMPGCLSYVVAADLAEADTLWVFEAWRSKADHDASLALPAVRDTLMKARPLIAGFEPGGTLRILGGLPR